MKVPQGFEKHYDPKYYVLLLLQTIYGLKQAAMAFWKKLLECFSDMGYDRCKGDPCLYYKWTKMGLILWISWIDECLVVESKEQVSQAKYELKRRFDCDETGNMDEYVGCKIERNWNERYLRFTQPVMIQSFSDEFNIEKNKAKTPAEPGQVLLKCDEKNKMSDKDQTTYRSGVGKLLHMMRWSRPEILNAVRELSKHT